MLPPVQTEDHELMERYRAGDAAAFEQLYERHKAPVYRYLLRQCNNSANAEEVFQEVWIKVIRGRDNYRPLAKFTTWLYQVARNCFIDFVRRQGRNALNHSGGIDPDELLHEADGPEAMADLSQSARRLAAALAELPSEQREAFLLRTEGGFGIDEIASITDTGRETAKSRLRYALKKLRQILEDTANE